MFTFTANPSHRSLIIKVTWASNETRFTTAKLVLRFYVKFERKEIFAHEYLYILLLYKLFHNYCHAIILEFENRTV